VAIQKYPINPERMQNQQPNDRHGHSGLALTE